MDNELGHLATAVGIVGLWEMSIRPGISWHMKTIVWVVVVCGAGAVWLLY